MTARSISRMRMVGNQMIAHLTDGATQFINHGVGGEWLGLGTPPDGTNNPVPPTAPTTTVTPTGVGHVTDTMVLAAVNSVGASVSAMLWTPAVVASMFNDAINKGAPGSFFTINRLAALVGECAEETQWFQKVAETSPPPGMGVYYGRGFIQLTWQSNYLAFGEWMVARGVTTDPNLFVNTPDLVTDAAYVAYTAIYYFCNPRWGGNNLVWFTDHGDGINNSALDTSNWYMTSRGINVGSPYSTTAAYNETERNTVINAVVPVTTAPDSGTGGTTLADRQQILRTFALDHIGDFFYTQDGAMRNDMLTSGAGDCSSWYVLCYTASSLAYSRSVFGGTSSTPGWTGTLGSNGTLVNNTGNPSDGPMQIGDCVLFGSAGYPWVHTAMYMGGDEISSHGGPSWSDKGPQERSLSANVAWFGRAQVRRFLI